MKILLTGILPYSVWRMAERLRRGGHHVTVLGGRAKLPERPAGITFHDMHPGHADALRLMEAARYQSVIFFFATQCEDAREYGSVQGAMLDALFAMLNASVRCGVERFALVTDRRVFGAGQAGREDETPIPDTPTGVLIRAAEDCLNCGAPAGLKTLLVRVTSLYAQDDPESFFACAADCAREGVSMALPGREDTPCDFLHADDLALFLDSALTDGLTGAAHLRYGVAHTYGEVCALLQARLKDFSVTYDGREGRLFTLEGTAARAVSWVPRHDFAAEIDQLARSAGERAPSARQSESSGLRARLSRAVPYLELLLLAAAAHFLTASTALNNAFRFVDYFLLFVAVMGNIHGRRMGILAALLACLDYALMWVRGGNDLYLLIYNMDNWLPLSCYLLAGVLFGYLRDKQRENADTLRREMQEQAEQNAFLQTMYHQAYEDRNRLQEQVMRYRDSYGRIYHITKELDTLQPEQVFVSTLDVMEDTMQNRSVAIYSRKGDAPFARLIVHSRAMHHLPRSLDLAKYEKLTRALGAGKTYANTTLEPGYPVYAAPVIHDGKLIAAIMLWDVPFDRQTLYYENLFSVVAGLVQSAMVRALRYFELSADVYVEGTHILGDQAFLSALSVYQGMRKRRTGRYLLVRVRSGAPMTAEEYDERIGRVVRATDIAGRMKDGAFYVIFPQATAENLPPIAARFAGQGLECELVSQEVSYV